MNSPAPNIPGVVSAMSAFTEYIMNELELEATSEDDIRAGDETLDAIFAEDHALGWWRSIVGRSHSLLWTSIKSHLPTRESMPP
jgi:hypothetical protein